MRIFLFILCFLSFLVGLMILAGAQSAIHEIEAFLLFLIAAVFLVRAAIGDAIEPTKVTIAVHRKNALNQRLRSPPAQR